MATPDQTATQFKDEDERLLAELGYKQQLNRAWSGFSNFAISFSIISVLAGCFTAYATGWNNGGPIAISIGWPVVSLLILIIGFSLAELVAKYPTSGGIYWFAGKLGGPVWAWFTGWFNMVGLIGVVASVQYACAGFMNVALRRLRARHLRRQLRRHRAHPRRELPPLRDHPHPHRDHQHLPHPPARGDQQRLGLVARDRRRGDHRAAGDRPRHSTRASASSSASGSTTPASTTAPPAASSSGSTCCRSGSC